MTTNEAVNEGGLLVCTEAWTNVVNEGYVVFIQSQEQKTSQLVKQASIVTIC